MSSWQDEQAVESEWWGNCTNTFGEELKQTVYASLMKLDMLNEGGPGPVIEMGDKKIIDIGGGPCSLLLKTRTTDTKTLIEPCKYPIWVYERYTAANVLVYNYMKGEDFPRYFRGGTRWDECWIYNVLQHTDDPERVVKNALDKADVVRIFEWIDMPVSPGHPHTLTEKLLNEWFDTGTHNWGSLGNTHFLNTNGCVGRAFVGVYARDRSQLESR